MSTDARRRAVIARLGGDDDPIEEVDDFGNEVRLEGGLAPRSNREASGPAELTRRYGRQRR